MLLIWRFVFENKINHQFDHENLHDFIGDSIPVTDSLIAITVLLLKIVREFLKPEIDIQGNFDAGCIDIHHHILQH